MPVGTFTAFSFGATVVLFGAGARAMAGGDDLRRSLQRASLYRTKNLTDCVAAHATSNALLAAWVLVRGDCGFW